MSAPVDVLAVLDDEISAFISFGISMGSSTAIALAPGISRLQEVRAAVAAMLEALEWVDGNPDDSAYWIPKVKAAIARAKGEAA